MMEEMDNNKPTRTRKPTAAQLEKKALENREKIAMNLDNYDLAIGLCLSVIAIEGVSESNVEKANQVISVTLDKLMDL